MSIPASELVTITPRVNASTGGNLAFNGLFLTNNDLMPVDTIKEFTSASEVAEFFGYDSDAYKAASVYFAGYENSLQKPSALLFFRHLNDDAYAFVRGLPSDDEALMLTNLKAVDNGELVVNIGPAPLDLSGLNFTACNSLADCAVLLQDAINDAGLEQSSEVFLNAKVEYSSLTKAFSIFAGVAGPSIAVDYANGNVADVMGLSQARNATISKGGSKRSYSETMDVATSTTSNFVSFATVEEVTNLADAQALASWCSTASSSGDQRLYVFHTTDVTLTANSTASQSSSVGVGRVDVMRVVNAGSGADIIDDFTTHNYEGVTAVYGDVRYAAFVMGCAASIDWDQAGSTITLAFKRQDSLEAAVTDVQTARKLKSLKVNYMGNYASRNKQFILFYPGKMFGSYSWIDPYLNSIWLHSELQATLLDGFATTGRVSHTDTGYNQIFAWLQGPIRNALVNGVIETGVELDETQTQAINREAGLDISSSLSTNGYYLQINAATAQQRSNRESPPCNFWYTYGGAVHKLELPATAIL